MPPDINSPEEHRSIAEDLIRQCAYKSEYYGGSRFTSRFSHFSKSHSSAGESAMKIVGLVFEEMCKDFRPFHLYELIDLTDHAVNRHCSDIESVIDFFDETPKFRKSKAIQQSICNGIAAVDAFGYTAADRIKHTRYLRTIPAIREAIEKI